MKITTIGRHMTVGEDQKELAIKKLSKFEKFFGPEAEAFVTFGYKRKLEIIEISISYNGMLFRSEEESSTFANALDEAMESLERQIRKNKTRLERKLKDVVFDNGIFDTGEEFEEEAEFKIRRKAFPIKPMSVEEAIMQMNLLGHEFFVFRNDQTEEICVVYKRNNGDYGLIEDEQ